MGKREEEDTSGGVGRKSNENFENERKGASVVSLAAVFSIVTQRSSPCVTILKTAARETSASVERTKNAG